MRQGPTSRADVLEKEYEAGTGLLIRGGIVLLVSLILVWILRLAALTQLAAFFGLTGVIGIVIMALGGRRMYAARSLPTVSVDCPYCGRPNQFLSEPTEDWTCENCSRPVYYENGVMAPVREVTCPSCRAEHKVSTKSATFTCDRCNRTLRLAARRACEDRGRPHRPPSELRRDPDASGPPAERCGHGPPDDTGLQPEGGPCAHGAASAHRHAKRAGAQGRRRQDPPARAGCNSGDSSDRRRASSPTSALAYLRPSVGHCGSRIRRPRATRPACGRLRPCTSRPSSRTVATEGRGACPSCRPAAARTGRGTAGIHRCRCPRPVGAGTGSAGRR